MQKIDFTTVRRGRHSGKKFAESIYIDFKDAYTKNHAGQLTVQTTYSKTTGAEYDCKPQEEARISVYCGNSPVWEGTLLQLVKLLQVDTGEATLLAAVISHNCFDDLYNYYKQGEIFTCDAISVLAEMFEAEYRHVTEWSEYLESIGFDGDWEMFVMNFVRLNKDNIPAIKNQGGK